MKLPSPINACFTTTIEQKNLFLYFKTALQKNFKVLIKSRIKKIKKTKIKKKQHKQKHKQTITAKI